MAEKGYSIGKNSGSSSRGFGARDFSGGERDYSSGHGSGIGGSRYNLRGYGNSKARGNYGSRGMERNNYVLPQLGGGIWKTTGKLLTDDTVEERYSKNQDLICPKCGRMILGEICFICNYSLNDRYKMAA